ncbi:hypothetical protein DFH09DRAFT_1163489 [Mycena vulgaris]|nr:hypothetical protein DFH09DRAFT_1163489 [Mycena vulgaris]
MCNIMLGIGSLQNDRGRRWAVGRQCSDDVKLSRRHSMPFLSCPIAKTLLFENTPRSSWRIRSGPDVALTLRLMQRRIPMVHRDRQGTLNRLGFFQTSAGVRLEKSRSSTAEGSSLSSGIEVLAQPHIVRHEVSWCQEANFPLASHSIRRSTTPRNSAERPSS